MGQAIWEAGDNDGGFQSHWLVITKAHYLTFLCHQDDSCLKNRCKPQNEGARDEISLCQLDCADPVDAAGDST